MKKFIFTLQSVLNMKVSLERQHMAELGACELRLKQLRQQLAALHDRLDLQVDAFNTACAEGVTPADLSVYAVGFRALREKIETQRASVEVAEQEKRRIQSRLVEIMQERKMLEKLREKQYEEYKLLIKAEDAAVMDDFMTHKIHQPAP